MGWRITSFLSAGCGIVGFFVSFVMAAEDCSDLNIQLQDSNGAVATIVESYDCWHEEGVNKCRSINSFPGRLRLTGSRVHRVFFLGKEYAFVEALRDGGGKYLTGAFEWNETDWLDFVKTPRSLLELGASERNFDLRNVDSLNRIFGISIPPPLLGKLFILNPCN